MVSFQFRFQKHTSSSDRQLPRTTTRSHLITRFNRKWLIWLFPFKGKSGFYVVIIFVLFLFALASMVSQSSIMFVLRQVSGDCGRLSQPNMKFGTTLKFEPGRFMLGDGLDRVRLQLELVFERLD